MAEQLRLPNARTLVFMKNLVEKQNWNPKISRKEFNFLISDFFGVTDRARYQRISWLEHQKIIILSQNKTGFVINYPVVVEMCFVHLSDEYLAESYLDYLYSINSTDPVVTKLEIMLGKKIPNGSDKHE